MSQRSRRDFLKVVAATTLSLGVDGVVGASLVKAASKIAASSTNLALYQPVDTSSSVDASHTALQAVDGNMGTAWVASNALFPQWLVVDLGAIATITSVTQSFANNTTWYYQIQGSNTNLSQDLQWTDWQTLVDNVNSGLYLGITSGSTNQGATADQDVWYGVAAQKWMLALV